MILSNFPDAAEPVREILRRDVPRPELPKYQATGPWHLFWEHSTMGNACAMMLHQQYGITLWGGDAFRAFEDWFDVQTDPQDMVDTIWGLDH